MYYSKTSYIMLPVKLYYQLLEFDFIGRVHYVSKIRMILQPFFFFFFFFFNEKFIISSGNFPLTETVKASERVLKVGYNL